METRTRLRKPILWVSAALLEVLLLFVALAPVTSTSKEQLEAARRYQEHPTEHNLEAWRAASEKHNAPISVVQHTACGIALIFPAIVAVFRVRQRRTRLARSGDGGKG